MRISLGQLCAWYGISRQAHYQMKQRQEQRTQEGEEILEMVRAIRRQHPRMGGRKLYQKIQEGLSERDIQLGRDRFFELLRRHNLLIRPRKRRYRTTWPGKWRCENLLATADITRPNQAWVCDLTYIATENGFAYLALVTDLYSRRILGYDLSRSLSQEGVTRALQRALAQADQPLDGLIHHSDHGIQYTSLNYRQLLTEHGIRSSMGEVGNCYDNAVAERVNGILKLEYGLDATFVDFVQAQIAVTQAVWLYNHDRPHLALDFQTPMSVYHHAFHNH
jgi:putative transposase